MLWIRLKIFTYGEPMIPPLMECVPGWVEVFCGVSMESSMV